MAQTADFGTLPLSDGTNRGFWDFTTQRWHKQRILGLYHSAMAQTMQSMSGLKRREVDVADMCENLTEFFVFVFASVTLKTILGWGRGRWRGKVA